MLVLEIETSKLPRFDLKLDSITKMTFLYDARYSVVLLRPKNEVKPLTQSVANGICMGK